jgi:hypothetical protein
MHILNRGNGNELYKAICRTLHSRGLSEADECRFVLTLKKRAPQNGARNPQFAAEMPCRTEPGNLKSYIIPTLLPRLENLTK